MKIKEKIVLLTFIFLWSSLGLSQDSPPQIVATGNINYCADAPVSIVTSVSITDPDPLDTTLDAVVIQISQGYAMGQDLLSLVGSHPNINAIWSQSEGTLTLNGPATFLEYEQAILNTQFTTTQTVFTSNRSLSINLGNANFLPSTGHYYFYVPQLGITWTQARTEASMQSFFGLTGYLATLTTIEEARLAGEQSVGVGWIGASDAANEGIWEWVTGPEAGTQFYNQNTNSAINGAFSFWNTGEPNNSGNEDYAHITDPSIGIFGSWNDLSNTGETDPSNPFHPQGYVVEFGGLPGDPVINLSASTTINMPQISINNTTVCQFQNSTLTVISNTDNTQWFETETSNTVVNVGNSYDVSLNTNTTFWVSPKFVGCSSGERFPFSITVMPQPSSQNIVINQCENNDVFDGMSIFNLEANNEAVADGIITNRTVSYFEDIDLTIQITNITNYQNRSNGQTIYAKIEDTGSMLNCFATAEITLNVSETMAQSFNYRYVMTLVMMEEKNLIY